MSDSIRPTGNGSGGGRFPIPTRSLAIMLMLAGVAAFVFSQLVFRDQVLCLLGSTLITFAGLGIVLYSRRSGQGQATRVQPEEPRQRHVDQQKPALPRRTPSGLREAARRQAMDQFSAPASPIDQSQEPPQAVRSPAPLIVVQPEEPPLVDRQPLPAESLLDQVVQVIRGHGSQVAVETQRHDRAVLRVQTQDEKTFTVLVREGAQEVEVADVRALFALVNNGSSDGGYLIASAPFTQQAYDWAGAHKIRLVQDDELGELSL